MFITTLPVSTHEIVGAAIVGVNLNICKKTYQFTTVCKDDVMISVL